MDSTRQVCTRPTSHTRPTSPSYPARKSPTRTPPSHRIRHTVSGNSIAAAQHTCSPTTPTSEKYPRRAPKAQSTPRPQRQSSLLRPRHRRLSQRALWYSQPRRRRQATNLCVGQTRTRPTCLGSGRSRGNRPAHHVRNHRSHRTHSCAPRSME